MKSSLMPLLLNLESRRVVVFGGGNVGHRKASLFSRYCHVDVVSRSFVSQLKELENSRETVRLIEVGELDEDTIIEHARGAFIVVAATDNEELNEKIAHIAHENGALVNSVHDVLDVVVPSIVEGEGVVLAISTRGASPAMSKFIRQRLEGALEASLSPEYLLMVRLQSELREHLKRVVGDQQKRARLLWSVLESEEVWESLASSYEEGFKRALMHIEMQLEGRDE
ncbi:precorrin-2 dehydrogenase/sirohydrochlorin ferrochelatase family protein [Methermicoccus shengliensis]|uniref:precorrin-2 dehydrogenase n=1 Tax=Methermicoccus shengliensis TaxID=660064 RepID=A0A832RVQ9_9EURY|nr:bifunctional precorrin-2 dehydrogenase/sirohydrochlorin ferrochelatase [Methermicoccus shengliensis]KUK30285.1 MAG: Siroheme synthase [Methanosarcinales archeaon 56_1174]MDI3488116.1 precorrin-2 dehydrogenase [Methanosarcinales archaeon]HIH69206.1 bifunctional precorrin-2 dehydrogenase/sirohydrochlorin ferrochelatase [Methermicoccus shengliensis]